MWGNNGGGQRQSSHQGYQEIRQSYQQQIQQSYQMQHGVQQLPQPLLVGQQVIRRQQDPPSQAYTLEGHVVPQMQQSYQVNSGGQNYGQQATYQMGGMQQSFQELGPRQSKGLWAQSRAEQVAAVPQSTSPWDSQGTSAFGAAFESFLNKGSVEEVAEVKPKQSVSPLSPPTHRPIPVKTRRKSLTKTNGNLQSSALQVPAAVEPSKVQELVEKVTKEVPGRGRKPATMAHRQIQVQQPQNLLSYNTAPLVPAPDPSDFSSFFSPVKAARGNVPVQQETLSESCEMTKRVNNYLKRVEQEHPAPGVWPSLPGPSDVQGPKAVEVKRGNLELVKSETLFVPAADVSSPCTLCAKVFASEARLAAHQASVHAAPQFPCSKCGKAFKRETGLRFHNCNDLDSSLKKKRRKREVVEVEKLLVEDGDTFVETSAPPKEVLEQEREPDIGPIVEGIELDLDVVALHYMVNFLPGVAVEEGNLPWLEEETEEKEALEEMLSRDQRLFEVVEVIKEREQLVVVVDIDAAEVKDPRSLPEWSEEVASLCGWKHMEVLEIIEKQMKEGLETDEGTVELALFPWQLLPSQWEKGEKARKEKQEEKKAEEAAEMWKKQALMMSLPKEVNSSTSVTSKGRSSSYGSRTSTYFDKSVLQADSGDDSDEEEWTPGSAAHRCNICRKNFPSRSSLRQHGKQHTKGNEGKNDKMVKDIKKVEGGTEGMRVKEVTLDEKPDLLGQNATSEERPGGVKENVTGAEEAAMKTTDVVGNSTAKPLILHSTLC